MGILGDLKEIFFGSGESARLERMRIFNRIRRMGSEFLTLVAQGSLLTIAVIPLGVALVLAIVIVMQSGAVESARLKLQAREALSPIVPTVVRTPLSDMDVLTMLEQAEKIYPVLNFSYEEGLLHVEARSTDFYPTFDRFLAHIDMYHPDWRVRVESFCAGRECGGDAPLMAKLSFFTIAIEKPAMLDKK